MPLDEVLSYVSEKMEEVDTFNLEMRRAGQKALKKALTRLSYLCSGGPREGKDFESTDLMAATALARLSIDTLKLARAGVIKKDASSPDLFDAAASANPWNLKKIE